MIMDIWCKSTKKSQALQPDSLLLFAKIFIIEDKASNNPSQKSQGRVKENL